MNDGAESSEAGAPPGPGAPRAARAPRAPRPVPPPPPPSKVKKHLMLSIIFLSLGLIGLIGFRVWSLTNKAENVTINVREEFEAVSDRSKSAGKEIFRLQGRTGMMGETLKPEELATIKTQLTELEACDAKFNELLALKGMEDSQERVEILPRWLQNKLLILDAGDFLESAKAAPEYAGLNAPMYRTLAKLQATQKEIGEINTLKAEIQQKNDKAEKEKTVARLKELEDVLMACSEGFQKLDDYVTGGLARPDLSPRIIPELDTLREERSRTLMMKKQARELRLHLSE